MWHVAAPTLIARHHLGETTSFRYQSVSMVAVSSFCMYVNHQIQISHSAQRATHQIYLPKYMYMYTFLQPVIAQPGEPQLVQFLIRQSD